MKYFFQEQMNNQQARNISLILKTQSSQNRFIPYDAVAIQGNQC